MGGCGMKEKPLRIADLALCCGVKPHYSLGTYYRIVCPVCAYLQFSSTKQQAIRTWNENLKLTPRNSV